MAVITNKSSIVFYSGQLRRKVSECEESRKRGDNPEVREKLLNEIKELEKVLENLRSQITTSKMSQ
jgi:hypothetical protein